MNIIETKYYLPITNHSIWKPYRYNRSEFYIRYSFGQEIYDNIGHSIIRWDKEGVGRPDGILILFQL